MSKWKRFEESDKDDRCLLPSTPKESTAWVVIWDNDGQIFFTTNPNNWGGSGWYADPEDVISKPEGLNDD